MKVNLYSLLVAQGVLMQIERSDSRVSTDFGMRLFELGDIMQRKRDSFTKTVKKQWKAKGLDHEKLESRLAELSDRKEKLKEKEQAELEKLLAEIQGLDNEFAQEAAKIEVEIPELLTIDIIRNEKELSMTPQALRILTTICPAKDNGIADNEPESLQ